MDPHKKFQQALPFVLLPIHPSLSALHSARARLQSHSQSTIFCTACGTYLHNGSARVRFVRSQSTKTRVREMTCLACEHIQTTPIDFANPMDEPDNRSEIETPEPSVSRPAAETASSTPPLNTPSDTKPSKMNISISDGTTRNTSLDKQAKPRPKKKTGLQAMLMRNKEQEEKRLQNQTGKTDSLSAFLSGL